MTHLTLSLDAPKQQLVFRIDDHPPTRAPFDASDIRLLRQLSLRYSQAQHDPNELVAVGGALARWLDAKHSWFEQVLDADLPPPLYLEICSPARSMSPAHAALINAPWELLYRDAFLCIDIASMLIPVRRIGTPAVTHASAAAPLGILFMAAAPADEQLLDYEHEESEILKSCRHLALNIAVEETGTLPELRAHLARRRMQTHVLHLVCHGSDDPPRLILEDELGQPAPATPDEIYTAIGPDIAQSLGLLFLSACFTASPDATSLALGLVRANFPAILGWASAVYDRSARIFAAKLFTELARGDTTLQLAVAQARRGAYLARLPDWHLARLYLGPRGGGYIIEDVATSVPRPAPSVAFLDEANRRLQVASFETFVGRRTELKAAIRQFRQPEATTLLIHGPGFSGKSSLAARIASRMQQHTKVVMHQNFVAAGIFESLHDAFGSVLTDWYISTRRPVALEATVSEDIRLFHYFRDLLDNHLPTDQPVLLILDDFEHALEQFDGGHRPTEAHVPLITALVRAFNTTRSNSRLLITSRFAFSLASFARNTETLTEIQTIAIADFSLAESMKRALREPPSAPGRDDLRTRCAHACRGNPALLDLLLRQIAADYERGASILDQVEHISDSHSADPELRTFLLEAALQETLDNASAQQLDAFEVSTWFRAPLSTSMADTICTHYSTTASAVRVAAMTSLGLWTPTPASTAYLRATALLSAISQRSSRITEPSAELARQLLPLAVDEARAAPDASLSYDIIRLSALADIDTYVPAYALSALAWMTQTHPLSETLDFAKRLLSRARDAGTQLDYQTHTYLALMFRNSSDAEIYQTCLTMALQQYAEQPEMPGKDADAGILLFEAGIAASRRGEHEHALAQLELAAQRTPATHQLSFFIDCQICREHVSLLRLDEATEQLTQLESSAQQFDSDFIELTLLGCQCDLRLARSQFGEALALQRRMVDLAQRSGDTRSVALALSQIGEILMLMGDHEAALKIWVTRARPTFEELGESASVAMVDAKIAHLKFNQGAAAEARALLVDNVLPHLQVAQFHEQEISAHIRIAQIDESLCEFRRALDNYQALEQRLRDTKLPVAHATVLAGIASCKAQLGELSEAIDLLEQTVIPLLQHGPPREHCVALDTLAYTYHKARRYNDAVTVLREQLRILADLPDARSRGITYLRLAEALHDGKLGAVGEIMDCAKRAETALKASHSRRELASVARIFAELEFDRGNHSTALRMIHDESFSVFINLKDTLSAVNALKIERDMLTQLGRHADAAEIGRAQVELYRVLDRKEDMAATSGITACLLVDAGDHRAAKAMLSDFTVPLFTEINDAKGAKTAYFQLHLVELALGDIDSCIDAFVPYIRYADGLGDHEDIVKWSLNLAMKIQDASITDQPIEHVGRLLATAHRYVRHLGADPHRFFDAVHELGLQMYLSKVDPKES